MYEWLFLDRWIFIVACNILLIWLWAYRGGWQLYISICTSWHLTHMMDIPFYIAKDLTQVIQCLPSMPQCTTCNVGSVLNSGALAKLLYKICVLWNLPAGWQNLQVGLLKGLHSALYFNKWWLFFIYVYATSMLSIPFACDFRDNFISLSIGPCCWGIPSSGWQGQNRHIWIFQMLNFSIKI